MEFNGRVTKGPSGSFEYDTHMRASAPWITDPRIPQAVAPLMQRAICPGDCIAYEQ